ncbi:MAG: hypothetical protein R3F61_15805 [Myxococcota bacterium]
MIPLLVGTALAQDSVDAVEVRRLEMAVTTSRGRNDGLVVFWPRIIPSTLDSEVSATAAQLQQRLVDIAKRAAPIAHRDVRPEPERVCPRDRGCRATSLGVLLGQRDGGCVAVALLGPPGTEDLELVPLAGTVELASTTVPFRATPEDAVTVREFVPCSKLQNAIDDSALVLRLREVLRD